MRIEETMTIFFNAYFTQRHVRRITGGHCLLSYGHMNNFFSRIETTL